MWRLGLYGFACLRPVGSLSCLWPTWSRCDTKSYAMLAYLPFLGAQAFDLFFVILLLRFCRLLTLPLLSCLHELSCLLFESISLWWLRGFMVRACSVSWAEISLFLWTTSGRWISRKRFLTLMLHYIIFNRRRERLTYQADWWFTLISCSSDWFKSRVWWLMTQLHDRFLLCLCTRGTILNFNLGFFLFLRFLLSF